MSWITVTATAILFVVGVTSSPVDVPQPATDLLPPKVDSGPELATDLMPPSVSAEMPENNWPTNGDSENKNNAVEKILADTAEKVQEATEQPESVFSSKLIKIREKRHHKKQSYGGGGCGGGCGGGYQPKPVYQPVCNTCGGGGGGYGGHGGGGGGSYAQASAQASGYGR